MKIIRNIFFSMVAMMIHISLYATIPVEPLQKTIPDPPITLPEFVEADIISTIIAWMIGLTAVLTILAITWAGIQMVLAIGEEEKMKKARHTMIYAFIGLIVSGLAYSVVTLITNLNISL